MHRKPLLNLLEGYNPENPAEKLYRAQIIEFIQAHPNCFLRSLSVGHITASAWLVDRHNAHALLMHHKKLDDWFQLGGHCDGHPDVLHVAIKEAQEESGIHKIVPVHEEIFDIDVHTIPANPKEGAHIHYDVRFLLQVVSDEVVHKNAESKELRWVGRDKAKLPTTHQSVIRMFNKWTSL